MRYSPWRRVGGGPRPAPCPAPDGFLDGLLRGSRRLLVLVAMGTAGLRAANQPTEYDLKAVFLFHFTQFVSWPEETFARPDEPFAIGILGTDPFGPVLADVIRGESVGAHPLVVRPVRTLEAARRCQILYVAPNGEPLLDLRQLRDAPVLTVGESDAFYEKGGMVQFVTTRRHLRLKINLAGVRAHELTVSAKLLRVAEVSDSGPVVLELADPDENPVLRLLEFSLATAPNLRILRAAAAELGIGG
jgi:hypothetical protein